MKKIIFVVLLMLCNSAWALDDTPETRLREANRYLSATPPKALMADMLEQMSKNVPPEKADIFKASFMKYLDMDALTQAMKDALVKNFSTEELSALADFYGSPVGKSAMKKMGHYMADLMPVIQEQIGKIAARVTADMGADPK